MWSSDAADLADRLLARCTFPTGGAPVVCAVSGGADSLALLALAVRAGLTVTAVHVDHGLRAGSAAEARVVLATAHAMGAAFRAETVHVAAGPNLEARARTARYAVLPAGVLTGHTLDDQAETVLLNLLRGAGLPGLAGMRPAGHPLLGLRRAETTALCAALGLTPVRDPSNDDPVHLRNRVRHEVLPLLAGVARRDVAALLVRQAVLVRDDADLLDELAAALDPTDAPALAAAPAPLARRAVRRWLAPELGGYPPDADAVARVLAVAAGTATGCDVGSGVRVQRHHQRLGVQTRPGGVGSSRHGTAAAKGKWAQGIQPRSFSWIIKDRLAVCERPGGYGGNHRRVRRQEEIIWIREQGFGCVISLIPSPHNLHNYDELGVPYLHRPFAPWDDPREVLPPLYREMQHLMGSGQKVIVHTEEVGDRIAGVMGGFIRWSGLVTEGAQCISVIERLVGRQLEPFGRAVVSMAPDLPR